MKTRKLACFLSALVLLLLVACGPNPSEAAGVATPAALRPVPLTGGQPLRVVATTSIVGDVVGRVGGDRIQLTTLMAPGAEPHSYVPRPADSAAVYDAHVLFANGAGLEAFLEPMLANAGGHAARIDLSAGLALRAPQDDHAGEEGEVDPHVWFDVQNVIEWVDVVEQTLSAVDPAGAPVYEANAAAYSRELQALDDWVVAEAGQVPAANRKLIINHPVLGYFAGRYGFEQVGAVYPLSPSAEPSAADVAALERAIRDLRVPAVFAENTVNPALAEQVARDTGIELVLLYTDSLGGPDSGAGSYVDLIRYDVGAIARALK